MMSRQGVSICSFRLILVVQIVLSFAVKGDGRAGIRQLPSRRRQSDRIPAHRSRAAASEGSRSELGELEPGRVARRRTATTAGRGADHGRREGDRRRTVSAHQQRRLNTVPRDVSSRSGLQQRHARHTVQA